MLIPLRLADRRNAREKKTRRGTVAQFFRLQTLALDDRWPAATLCGPSRAWRALFLVRGVFYAVRLATNRAASSAGDGRLQHPAAQGKSPFMPAQMSPDSVVLEMFFIRFPFADPTINEKLWEEIKEAAIRRHCASGSRRTGFAPDWSVGRYPSSSRGCWNSATSRPHPVSCKAARSRTWRPSRKWSGGTCSSAGQRSEIIASGVYAQLPVLTCESGELCGQTYSQAQGMFVVKSFPQPDGRVRLELTPELHHDEPRQRWVGNQGVLRLETSRPKRVFDDLGLSPELVPGAMLLLSSLPNGPAASATISSPKTRDAWSRSCWSYVFRRRSTTGCSTRPSR